MHRPMPAQKMDPTGPPIPSPENGWIGGPDERTLYVVKQQSILSRSGLRKSSALGVVAFLSMVRDEA